VCRPRHRPTRISGVRRDLDAIYHPTTPYSLAAGSGDRTADPGSFLSGGMQFIVERSGGRILPTTHESKPFYPRSVLLETGNFREDVGHSNGLA